ncbi:MAG: hypothetical protein OEY33_06855 [Bdellovibrionales bacterium]|nr:hypothetical protein [Bdellovibrionales bacterium]
MKIKKLELKIILALLLFAALAKLGGELWRISKLRSMRFVIDKNYCFSVPKDCSYEFGKEKVHFSCLKGGVASLSFSEESPISEGLRTTNLDNETGITSYFYETDKDFKIHFSGKDLNLEFKGEFGSSKFSNLAFIMKCDSKESRKYLEVYKR